MQRCRQHGVQAECFVADVSDFLGCASMVKGVADRFGSIDVLVNCAGVTRDGPIARMSEEQYDTVVDVNLKGAFSAIRHVTPLMMKQRSGAIVNISSVVGIVGNRGQSNYAASKAGLIGLTKSVAGAWLPRHHLQRGGTRLYPNRHDRRHAGKSKGGHSLHHRFGPARNP